MSSFLAALALWLIFTTYGALRPPVPWCSCRAPAVHSLIDIGAVITGGRGAGIRTLVFLGGLLVVRSALVSAVGRGGLARLEGEMGPIGRSGAGVEGGHGSELQLMVRRAAGSFVSVLGIEAAFYVLSMVIAVIALGFASASLPSSAADRRTPVLRLRPRGCGGEGVRTREGFQLSIKAARQPGPGT